jgi:hypothetical protein
VITTGFATICDAGACTPWTPSFFKVSVAGSLNRFAQTRSLAFRISPCFASWAPTWSADFDPPVPSPLARPANPIARSCSVASTS